MDDKKKRVSLVYINIFPVLLFLSLELQNASAYGNGIYYIFNNIPAIAISCVLIYLTVMFLFSITGNMFASGILVSLVLLTFYTASFYRRMQTGQVLLPIDLNFAKQIRSIAAFSDLQIDWHAICSILCVFALHIPLFFASKRVLLPGKRRILIFTCSGVLTFLLFFTSFSRTNILPVFNIDTPGGKAVNMLYEDRGALMGFYTVGFTKEAPAPEGGYSQEHIENLLATITVDEDTDTYLGTASEMRTDIKPDVIVVMSESFIDPSVLPNITFSEDPVPNLHRLQAMMAENTESALNVVSGQTVVPVFGGLTCNTEYEFLTGNSMKFTGYSDIPYYDAKTYIDTVGDRSLPNMFRDNGYYTVALHTNTETFFDRNEHYPKLGFDIFVAAEDMEGAPIKGSFHGEDLISDAYFTDRLLEIVESTTEPLFLFGITMQNHTPYLPDKYETTRFKAYSSLLTEEDLSYVESYLEGVNDADAILGRLYDYVMNTEKPTIVLYFGDHLPLFTRSTGVYTELGYIDCQEIGNLTTEEAYKMYTTPYVAFSNGVELPEAWKDDISPYFLGLLTADAAGITRNFHYTFLERAFESFQAMNNKLYISNGMLYDEQPPDVSVLMFETFQYDRLFGEDYVKSAVMSTQR